MRIVARTNVTGVNNRALIEMAFDLNYGQNDAENHIVDRIVHDLEERIQATEITNATNHITGYSIFIPLGNEELYNLFLVKLNSFTDGNNPLPQSLDVLDELIEGLERDDRITMEINLVESMDYNDENEEEPSVGSAPR